MKRSYTYSDFIGNDRFIEWMLSGNEELDAYWAQFAEENPAAREALAEAVEKFGAVRLNANITLPRPERDEMMRQTIDRIKTFERRRKRRLYTAAASVAASVLVIAGALFFTGTLTRDSASGESFVIYTGPSENIRIMSGDKTMELHDNPSINVSTEKVAEIVQVGGRIEMPLAKEGMNRLEVPVGKRSSLTLSDGTRVWLNSGSALEFPSSFAKERRDVTVTGEVFFEVSHSDTHPFYVHTDRFSVRVYGTQFDVSAYAGDTESYVVLVEGSVAMETPDNRSVMLEPNHKLSFDPANGTVNKQKVAVEEYTSWRDGYLVFNDATMDEMLAKIKRYYNIDFLRTSGSAASKKETFSGKLHLSPSVDSVIAAISLFTSIEYERRDSTIYLNRE